MRAAQREDFSQYLTIKIALHAASTQSSQQTLVIDLTDESDPLFLYQMACTEQDFHQLKQEQQLQVDFQAFPNNLVELLNYCQSQQLNQGGGYIDDGASSAMMSSQSSQNKFVAVFDQMTGGVDSALSIVETNQFKALTYLSLNFRKANDEMLKKHLAAKLKESNQSGRQLD